MVENSNPSLASQNLEVAASSAYSGLNIVNEAHLGSVLGADQL